MRAVAGQPARLQQLQQWQQPCWVQALPSAARATGALRLAAWPGPAAGSWSRCLCGKKQPLLLRPDPALSLAYVGEIVAVTASLSLAGLLPLPLPCLGNYLVHSPRHRYVFLACRCSPHLLLHSGRALPVGMVYLVRQRFLLVVMQW